MCVYISREYDGYFLGSLHIGCFGSTYLWTWIRISDCVVFEICCVCNDSGHSLSNTCRCILVKTPWKWCCSYLWSGTFTEIKMMHVKFWIELLPSDSGSVRKVIFQWRKKQKPPPTKPTNQKPKPTLCHFIEATGAINPPKWLFANRNVW